MKLSIALVIFTVLLPLEIWAQHSVFPRSGKVTFEKKVNLFALLEKKVELAPSLKQAFELFKKTQPQFFIQKNELFFNNGSIQIFEEKVPVSDALGYFGSDPLTYSPSFTEIDLSTGSRKSTRHIIGQDFSVTDSVRKIRWKLTDEIREIAGYQCHRANGLIMDSVYVVAFYTTDIHISAGPASFTGLPGMILGIALPHNHISWFATNVEVGVQPTTTRTKTAPYYPREQFENELWRQLGNLAKSNTLWRHLYSL